MKKKFIIWLARKLGVVTINAHKAIRIEDMKYKVTDIQVIFTGEPALNFMKGKYSESMKRQVYIKICREAEKIGVLKYKKIIKIDGRVNIVCRMSVAVPVPV